MDPAVVESLRRAAARFFPERGLLAAYAHGSRISGSAHTESDLDVGYYLLGHRRGESLSVRDEMVLAADLSDEVGLPVDLRNLGEAPLELKGRVLEEGVRIYSGDDVERVALERFVLGRYHDYKDVFRQMHEIRLKRTAERGL